MRKLLLLLFISVMYACSNSTTDFSEKEKALICQGGAEESMAVLLVTDSVQNAFLRSVSVDIMPVEDNEILAHLLQRMLVTMDEEGGVGIAAPQVGIGRNVFLFTRLSVEGHPVQEVINPKITAFSERMIAFENDGCLSVPDCSATTNRYEWIDAEYYNLSGELIKERLFAGQRPVFDGVVFQHEFDHLQGKLFFDVIVEENKNKNE